LLVLLESRQVGLEEVLTELRSRMGTSGLAEKAARRGGSS
jgi:phosphoribosyl-ATP pyrophosphohydrolase